MPFYAKSVLACSRVRSKHVLIWFIIGVVPSAVGSAFDGLTDLKLSLIVADSYLLLKECNNFATSCPFPEEILLLVELPIFMPK